jgi:hypothetical protein
VARRDQPTLGIIETDLPDHARTSEQTAGGPGDDRGFRTVVRRRQFTARVRSGLPACGAGALSAEWGTQKGEAGDPTPKIARSVPPRCGARAGNTARKLPAGRRAAPTGTSAPTTQRHPSGTGSAGNPAIRDSQDCPPESAVIPISSAEPSTPRWPTAAPTVDPRRSRRHFHSGRRQTARKPGSVPPPAGLTAFGSGDGHSSGTPVAGRLVRPTRAAARRSRPAPRDRSRVPAAPTWSCSRWGFPCRRRCRRRGALLPHRFTLAARPGKPVRARRCPFCGTVPGVAPAGRYPAPYLRGARTFLSPHDGGERPSGRLAPTDLAAGDDFVKGPCQTPVSNAGAKGPLDGLRPARARAARDQGVVAMPTAAANRVLTFPPKSGLTRWVV